MRLNFPEDRISELEKVFLLLKNNPSQCFLVNRIAGYEGDPKKTRDDLQILIGLNLVELKSGGGHSCYKFLRSYPEDSLAEHLDVREKQMHAEKEAEELQKEKYRKDIETSEAIRESITNLGREVANLKKKDWWTKFREWGAFFVSILAIVISVCTLYLNFHEASNMKPDTQNEELGSSGSVNDKVNRTDSSENEFVDTLGCP